MKILYTTLIILVSFTNSFAGWFDCHIYEGKIGDSKIKMYIQLLHINSDSKDSILVNGVYSYNEFNTPILLEGMLINKNRLVMREIYEDKTTANISMSWSQDTLIGSWSSVDNNKILKIQLTKQDSINDTENEYQSGRTDILMNTSFSDTYLTGVYIKDKGYARATMVELQIRDKKTNEIFQIIDFSEYYYGVGNIMTDLFQNVKAIKDDNGKPWKIKVNTNEGKMGDAIFLRFCPCLNKYMMEI